MNNENIQLTSTYNFIKERGFYYQSTGEVELEKLLTQKPTTIYLGIDPTADSLHIGHCFPLFMLKQLQKAGHKIIIILGGATAMIGDPSGRKEMRGMVTKEFIDSNFEKIKTIISKFLKSDGSNPYILLNNADWYKGYDYINFMRDVAVHFNVNKMLATDACATRLAEGGLTFFEMGYMLMQAYDFVYLNRNYDCKLQVGGSDQWANMLAGAELGRKLNFMEGKPQEDFQAFTVPLLTTSAGVKMGKTEKGAIWVDETKTSPYEFYQYFYNVDDRDVEKLLKATTELSLQTINELMSGDIINAKRTFAYEITKAVHGEEKANKAREDAMSIFSKGNLDKAPEFKISDSQLPNDLAGLSVLVGLAKSKGEAKALIAQGGLKILSNSFAENENYLIEKASFTENGYLILQKGKKSFVKVVL